MAKSNCHKVTKCQKTTKMDALYTKSPIFSVILSENIRLNNM